MPLSGNRCAACSARVPPRSETCPACGVAVELAAEQAEFDPLKRARELESWGDWTFWICVIFFPLILFGVLTFVICYGFAGVLRTLARRDER